MSFKRILTANLLKFLLLKRMRGRSMSLRSWQIDYYLRKKSLLSSIVAFTIYNKN